MADWTYHAQNILTGEWVHRDLKLRDVEITEVLTGHWSLRATLAPYDATLVDGDGRILKEWQTVLYPEQADAVAGGFILTTPATFDDDGQAWHLSGVSFTGISEGEPYDKVYRGWQVDPLDVVREIFDFLKSRTNGDVGLVIDATTTPERIGDVQPPPKPHRADVTYGPYSTYGTPGDPWPRPARPKKPKRKRPKKRKRRRRESNAHYNAYLTRFNARLDRWKDLKQSLNKDRLPEWNAWHQRLDTLQEQWEKAYGDREPFKLLWWEQPDCGQELSRLADETPFEWREQHAWVDGTKTAVTHFLELGYPTLGVRHTDVAFAPGDKVAIGPLVERGEAGYANHIIAVGAGEGRNTRRGTSSTPPERLQRTAVLPAKDVKRVKRLNRLARKERKRLSLGHGVRELRVWDDSGDTLATYRLGDEIAVVLSDGWPAGTWWHKIVGRRYQPDEDDLVTFILVRGERVEPDDVDRNITVQYLSGTHAAELEVTLVAADGGRYEVAGVNDPAPGAVQDLGIWSLDDLGIELVNVTYHNRRWSYPNPEHFRRTPISGTDATGTYVGFRFEVEDGGSTGNSDGDFDDIVLDVKGYDL